MGERHHFAVFGRLTIHDHIDVVGQTFEGILFLMQLFVPVVVPLDLRWQFMAAIDLSVDAP